MLLTHSILLLTLQVITPEFTRLGIGRQRAIRRHT